MPLFLSGLLLSLMGSLPPGLISLTVAQTAIYRSFAAAMIVAAGAAFAEFFQAGTAVYLSDWFMSDPAKARIFQWAALPVFLGLGIYMLFFAKTTAKTAVATTPERGRHFFKGLMVSAFNLLAVPYWFVYCAWLKSTGALESGIMSMLVFSGGVSSGTMLALAAYAWLGQIAVKSSDKLALYANKVIGLIFMGLALHLLYQLVLP